MCYTLFIDNELEKEVQASIPRKHLAAAAVFAAAQDIRYCLNGVFIEVMRTEVRCAATDGNMAGVCRSRTEQERMPHVIVPNETIKIVLSANKSEVLALEFEEGKWSLGGIPFKPVDGTFPAYRRILTCEHSGKAAQFNPAFIAAFAKAGKALGIKSAPIIRHNGEGGAQVQFYGCDDFVGVLMPLRAFTEKHPDTGLIQWGQEQAV